MSLLYTVLVANVDGDPEYLELAKREREPIVHGAQSECNGAPYASVTFRGNELHKRSLFS